ncbi:hypothetical protein N8J89_14450 [Crossiella sp. CA-258035]|nr:hypothetical protein [Crossiella sp. CA-258035]WHT22217.1 hypothetical protein N8J89_14450 [Crossiella sp. CA-258035]
MQAEELTLPEQEIERRQAAAGEELRRRAARRRREIDRLLTRIAHAVKE